MINECVNLTLQTTIPMLTYEDVGAAADWLCSAFGFRESGERFSDDEGRVTHAELSYGDGELMLGFASPHYLSPRRHAAECEHAARWLDNPYVVDGVSSTSTTSTRTSRGHGRRVRRSCAAPTTSRSAACTPPPTSKATAGCSCSRLDSRKERRISFAAHLIGHLRSTTFTRAPSTARD